MLQRKFSFLLIFIFMVSVISASAQKWRLEAGYDVANFGLKFAKNPDFDGGKESTRKGVLQLELQRYFSRSLYISGTGEYLLQNQESLFGGPVNFEHASGGLSLGWKGQKWGVFLGGKVGRLWDINFKAEDTEGNITRIKPVGNNDAWVPALQTGLQYYLLPFLRLEAKFNQAFKLPDQILSSDTPNVTPVLQSAEIKSLSFSTGIAISIPWGKRNKSATSARGGKAVVNTTKGMEFSSPMRGESIITSPFGYRNSGKHEGIDLDARRGDFIHAVADGRVVEAGRDRGSGYGKMVKIRHKNGFTSLYAHLGSIEVSKGEKLKRGDVIGRAGKSGRSTGVHLHFEIRKNGQPVDPEGYIVF